MVAEFAGAGGQAAGVGVAHGKSLCGRTPPALRATSPYKGGFRWYRSSRFVRFKAPFSGELSAQPTEGSSAQAQAKAPDFVVGSFACGASILQVITGEWCTALLALPFLSNLH
ncbi:hypothetical protein GCM10025871_31430 [Deinococcus metallilatus]|nr:hypothetical protein GCM10025871_31430 [Deinococcus metallilatus]